MSIEWDGIIRAMGEHDPAGPETVVHIVNGRQRVAHVLERVDRERHIEPPRQVKLFARGADELKFDRIASTEFEDAPLQIDKEIEFLSQRFNGRNVQPLARQIGR